jgi:hypothetical protein
MMLAVEGREVIMARGALHRDMAKEQFWREQMAGQAGSSLSIRGYCRRHRLRESAFYFWRKELARRGADSKPKVAFVPVRITDEPPASPGASGESIAPGRIEIVLSDRRQIHVIGRVDRRAVADVLAVLEGRPC